MKLSIKRFTLACGILWGLSIFLVSVANFIWPSYGVLFLTIMASIYPGYETTHGVYSIISGTLYAIIDASIGGAIFAYLYNTLPE
jgi:hypothetical protein